jgi:hypothetical protein
MSGLWFELKRGVMKNVNAWRGRAVLIHINKTGGTSVERALHLRSERKTALQKRAEMGPEAFERAFSFAFVRNPWDKVVSHYHYRRRTGRIYKRSYDGSGRGDPEIGFRDWVERAYGAHDPMYYNHPQPFMAQTLWINDEEDRCLVSFVGRFERLADDFQQVCRELGVKASLPHVKPSPHAHYRELYDDATRDIVARRFASDIDTFGYTF